MTQAADVHLLVFGDQAIDKRPMIRNLVRNSKSSPAARRFLQEATDIVSTELGQMTPDEHGWSGNFETLLSLAEENAAREDSGTGAPLITNLTALIGRLGDLILRAERDPTILGSKDRPVHVLALCTGQLPAAAAVAARDTSELFTIAREILRTTCRWTRTSYRQRVTMISPTRPGGWSMTYVGLDATRTQAILDEFHAAQKIPSLHKVAIGVVSKSFLTLVGPASSLRLLTEFSKDLRQAPQVFADTGGPAHVPFMPSVDVDHLIEPSFLMDRPLDWDKVTMLSPSGDCESRQFGTLRELLCDIYDDILIRPLLVDKTIQSCVGRLSLDAKINVHEVGNTSHFPLVLKTLSAGGRAYDVVPRCEPQHLGSSLISRGTSDLIAIVGMAGRFPGSDNVDEFWNEIMSGACHIKEVPESRFDPTRYYDATQKLKNSTAAKDGAWLKNPGLFDNRFFNVSPREAGQMDPIQRLVLTTTHEALEMAGYAPGASPSMDPERVASFVGVMGSDWPENLHQQGIDLYYVTGAAKAFLSGKINYHYKFGRGSYTLDAVCASSTTAVTLACKSLILRDSDMAVAGGGSVYSAPFAFAGLSKSGMVSLNGGCRTFHDDADGYARAEGVGMVVLKRLEDALADKDNILGVISGSARMYSNTSTSITHPSHVSQEKVYKEVLGQTALDPEEIVYVEMHGTGTQAGDFEELTSVLNVMGGQRKANNPLTVGAVKAAMGHAEGAAGVVALIKTLMMLKHRTIPSQPGVPFKMNHRFPNLDKRNVRIALQHAPLRPSPKSADGRIKMVVNTFDASAGNCALVVEAAPQPAQEYTPEDDRQSHVVALSGRTALSLQRNCDNLLAHLEANPDIRLCDLAYTTTARRMHESIRKAFVCNSVQHLASQLRERSGEAVKKAKAPRVVMLFTGQGSQYTAMGMSLYESSTRFRELMDTYQLTASLHHLPQFLPIIAGTMDVASASPAQVQLAIVALELGVAQMLRIWGIVPTAVIGHSLGEYAALCVAGVLSPSDALYLVGCRALLMEQHLTPNTHAMLAIPMAADELEARIREESTKTGRLSSCAVACVNAPNATVASGTVSDIRALQEKLAGESKPSTFLSVPFAFHSAQIEPVLRELEDIASAITFKKPNVPVLSTLTGQLVDAEGVFGPSYLGRQAREPVQFVQALRAAEAMGLTDGSPTLWIESGPDAVCLGMVRKTLQVDAARLLPALKSDKDNWETTAGVLKAAYESGMSVSWKAYHADFSDSLRLLSNLPSYAWDYNNYWVPYNVPPAWEVEQALDAVKNGISTRDETSSAVAGGFVPTLSLHKLVEETLDVSKGTVKAVFSSETSVPSLKKAIEGHIVSDHVLVPLAIFCDMAKTAAAHCYYRSGPDASLENIRLTLQNMAIVKAVALTTVSQPVVTTTANYSRDRSSIDITFHQQPSAKDAPGTGPFVGSCRVSIDPVAAASTDLTPEQNQTVFLVKRRMQQLRELAADGKAHVLLRPVVYRLFGAFVRYGAAYRSMDKVIVSSSSEDALASLTAPDANESETLAHCALNPFVYDGVNQLAGFLLNNSLRGDDEDSSNSIYVSEGFSESRQWESLVPGRKYLAYSSGQDVDPNGAAVDVTSFIFDAQGERLVQMVTGIRFQKMRKVVLDHVLGGSSSRPAASSSTARPTASALPPLAASSSLPALTIPRQEMANKSREAVLPNNTTKDVPIAVNHSTPVAQDTSLMKNLLSIVAAEVGVRPEDMNDDTIFGDLGVDSLMAITVLSTLRNELGLDLPSTFFMDHDTVGAARQALLAQISSDAESSSSSASEPISSPLSSAADLDGSARVLTPPLPLDGCENPGSLAGDESKQGSIKTAWVQVDAPQPATDEVVANKSRTMSGTDRADKPLVREEPAASCKIIHLQGNPQQQQPSGSLSTAPNIFLLADETGSSVNYVQLPSVPARGACIYGVDWPASLDLSQPDYDLLIPQLADAMAASIAAHQTSSSSPCVLGGLGFGVILATEVAKRLPSAQLAGLLLLDPPATAADLERSSKKGSRLTAKKKQAERVEAAARAIGHYGFEQWNPALARPVVVVVPAGAGGGMGEDGLKKWLPMADVKVVEGGQQGGCMGRLPSVKLAPFLTMWVS